jgi:phage shock protein A
MALGPVARLWQVARKIEELFTLHAKVEGSLLVIDQRLKALEDRMLRLESEQTQIVTEARSAATAASTMLAGAVIAEAVTRITRLEGRADQLEQQRSLPPR